MTRRIIKRRIIMTITTRRVTRRGKTRVKKYITRKLINESFDSNIYPFLLFCEDTIYDQRSAPTLYEQPLHRSCCRLVSDHLPLYYSRREYNVTILCLKWEVIRRGESELPQVSPPKEELAQLLAIVLIWGEKAKISN